MAAPTTTDPIIKRKISPSDHKLPVNATSNQKTFVRWSRGITNVFAASKAAKALIYIVEEYTNTLTTSADTVSSLDRDEGGTWSNPHMDPELGSSISAAPNKLHLAITQFVEQLSRGAGGSMAQLVQISATVLTALDHLEQLGLVPAGSTAAVKALNPALAPLAKGADDAEIRKNHKKKHKIFDSWKTELEDNPIEDDSITWNNLGAKEAEEDQRLYYWLCETLVDSTRAQQVATMHKHSPSFAKLMCDLWNNFGPSHAQGKLDAAAMLDRLNHTSSKLAYMTCISTLNQHSPTAYDTILAKLMDRYHEHSYKLSLIRTVMEDNELNSAIFVHHPP